MNIKNVIVLAAAIATGFVSESVSAGTQERERVCLVIGKYAQNVAEGREAGTSEKEALSIPTPRPKGTPEGDLYVALQQVITWTYTVQLPPAESRKLVYAKCLAREFFAYNPKLDG